MQTRNNYCFEYLVTKAKMPRQRTCCPFMQRTLYRVTRNLARLDLGFTCPDLEGSASQVSTVTPTPKRRASSRRDDESRNSSGGVLAWLVRGTLGRRAPSLGPSDASTMPPVDDMDNVDDNDNDMLNEQGNPGAFDVKEDTTSGEPSEHLPLKQKRKLLRRQRIYDVDSSLDATTSGNWSEEKTNLGDSLSRPMENAQELVRSLPIKPPPRTVHIKRLHARRISSTSQAGQNSMEQTYAMPPQAQPAALHHAAAPLHMTPEIEQWGREVEETEGGTNESGAVPLSVPSASAMPPFAVREPVEKQVRNWLESTSDEYDILLKRWSGRTNKNGGENRSLDLRHQGSGESSKRVSTCATEASHKKHLPRLWKQTTPMSQAIIQNHLEHQHQSSVRSACKKELTVPSFGFDSGEMSMLQSLEENPEEDFMSLLPPVSSQRRFSDNPLMAKQHGGCAFQPMMSPTINNYSTRNLQHNVKLRSAPTRSFCCIYHKRHGFDRPYRSPGCACPCNQLRTNPTSNSYTEMAKMYPGEMALPVYCHSPHNSENLPTEGGCNCSGHRMNHLVVEDVANEVSNCQCRSPLPTPAPLTPKSLASPPFLTSPYRASTPQQHTTQERLPRQICHERISSDRELEPPFPEMMANNGTFEQELHRRLDREIHQESLDEGLGIAQPQASRLIPPDLVFSPASRRVSAVDIGEEVAGSSVINMLTINSPSRQLSRQNSIYSMEEGLHHQQQQITFSPQGSLCSERGAFLTPEYQTATPVIAGTDHRPKQWVKSARSFDHFSSKTFAVHRAASHSPSHLAACSRERASKPTVHRSDTDCNVRTPPRTIDCRLTQVEATSVRTPEFLSLDSSNSDSQHPESEFSREHRCSHTPEAQQAHCGRPHYRSDSSGESKRAPILLRLKPTSLTTSADCLKQQPVSGLSVALSAGHQRAPHYMNSHTYREAAKRLAQKKKQLKSGKELHPRKSLEVESVWSSSHSTSLQSSNSPSQNLQARSKSSELDIRGALSPTTKRVRRDYTIDEKTDEIFQAFLQHDPLMDDMTVQHPPKGRKKSLHQL